MLFTIFRYLFSFQRYSSFINMPISQVMMSYTQPKVCSNMMKRDISANLYQKCLIFCSKVLLIVLHNMSLTVMLPWQHTGFQTTPNIKCFSGHLYLAFHSDICQFFFICIIQQGYEYVWLILWPCLMFFELKITKILKSAWLGQETSDLLGNMIFCSHTCRCVACVTINVPSFKGLCCKLTKIDQTDISFSCICPAIDHEFHHSIVSNRTDALKTGISLFL